MSIRRIATASWRLWAMLIALIVSIPAFYDTLMPEPTVWALVMYGLSAGLITASTWQTDPAGNPSQSFWSRPQQVDRVLAVAMLSCAFLPYSNNNTGALAWRLTVELLTLARLLSLSQTLWTQTGLLRLIAMSAGLLGMCGVGFYWIDPQINSVEDGMWLAFTTAATVGFGDVVPNTTASRIFSVFVVLLGYGVLSLVTASIAAMFVGTQERKVEQEILRDMHAQLRSVRKEIAELRAIIDAQQQSKPHAHHQELTD